MAVPRSDERVKRRSKISVRRSMFTRCPDVRRGTNGEWVS